MRKNLHHILIVFSIIDEKGHGKFLEQFLNPEYSFFDYKFDGFDPKSGSYKNVISKKLIGINQQNNIKRYHRVAFAKLQEYKIIENRKTNIWNNKQIDTEIESLFVALKSGKNKIAKTQLEKVFKKLADFTASKW